MSGRSDDWVLAIDFGTTATAAATSRNGVEQIVEIDGSPRMPSMVCWSATGAGRTGRLLLGEAAENEAILAPEALERCPKGKLGQEFVYLGAAQVRVTDAVGQIYGAVLEEAIARQGGRPPSEVRLTHPAKWGVPRLDKLREAAAVGGLQEPRLIPEPVGAAVYFAGERLSPGEHVAVYDLGGGTFDTAVLRRSSDGFEVVGEPGGRDDLGGEDFDDRLYRYLGAQLDPDRWRTLTADDADLQGQRAHYDFVKDVRRAKERLSRYAVATVRTPIPGEADLQVSAREFEQLIDRDIESTVDELDRTIADAGLSVAGLSSIYLTGGSSRIPLVARLISSRLDVVPSVLGDPKAVIALGAARVRWRSPSGVTRQAPPVNDPAPTTGEQSGSPRAAQRSSAESSARRGSVRPAAPAAPGGPPRSRMDRVLGSAAAGLAGAMLLAGVAALLALVDGLRAGASSPVIVASAARVLGAAAIGAGFVVAALTWRTRLADRWAGLRTASWCLAGGFGVGTVAAIIQVLTAGHHHASKASVVADAARAAFAACAAAAAGKTALTFKHAAHGDRRQRDEGLGWAATAAATGVLALTARSIAAAAGAGARSHALAVAGLAAQGAGEAIAAAAALILALSILAARDVDRRRGIGWAALLAPVAAASALGTAVVTLGGALQVGVNPAHPDARMLVAAWLIAARGLACALVAGYVAVLLRREHTVSRSAARVS